MIEGWGMTETSPAGTQTVYGGKRQRGSCGLPLPGATIDIVDVDNPLQVLGINQTGQICITAIGYGACRARVCLYVSISVGDLSCNKKNKTTKKLEST